jgi:transcriptional regulator with XRE-family HTH domain
MDPRITPFWQYLANWLRAEDWTQTEFADAAGVHQTVVSKWLHADYRRRVRPGRQAIPRVAVVLKLEPEQVVRMVLNDQADIDHTRLASQAAAAADRTPQEEIGARRQAVRDQLDVWLSAVGPENEGAFWDSLKAQGQATVNLIRRVGTADNAGTEAADNAAVMSRAERGRGRRNGPNGQIMSKQHAVGPALGAGRHASNHRQAA